MMLLLLMLLLLLLLLLKFLMLQPLLLKLATTISALSLVVLVVFVVVGAGVDVDHDAIFNSSLMFLLISHHPSILSSGHQQVKSSNSKPVDQDGPQEDSDHQDRRRAQQAGHLHQEEVRLDEEGVRAECVVRLRDLGHHLQLTQQALPVRFHRHGQGSPEVHR